jgi:hypothetical protein
MSLTNYTDLQTGIQNWLQRTDLSTVIPDFIMLFEREANRRLRVREMEAIATLTPTATVNVTGAANNGSGAIRLTLASTSPPWNGDQVTVASVGGTTEANGTFQVSLIDTTHVDLVGSTFTNAYTSGGTVSEVGSAALPADYIGWRGNPIWIGNPNRELEFAEPAVMVSRYPNIPIDLPSLFTIEASIFRVMPQDPTPIKFLYYQKIPALSNTNTTNWLMSAHPDLYLFGALAEAHGFTVAPEYLELWKSRRDELFDEVIRVDARTRGPSNIRVIGPTP